MENSILSSGANLVSGSEAHLPDRSEVLDYEDYDIFQPSREIDAIIDNKLYIGESVLAGVCLCSLADFGLQVYQAQCRLTSGRVAG